jgi:hypothetical protein
LFRSSDNIFTTNENGGSTFKHDLYRKTFKIIAKFQDETKFPRQDVEVRFREDEAVKGTRLSIHSRQTARIPRRGDLLPL